MTRGESELASVIYHMPERHKEAYKTLMALLSVKNEHHLLGWVFTKGVGL